MSTTGIARTACGLILLAGSCGLAYVYAGRAAPAVQPDPPGLEQGQTGAAEPQPMKSFEIDIAGVQERLGELPEDERVEQIADWAVYGTLLQRELPAESLRSAAFDRVPFRESSLVETVSFDYGPGRRVVLDGQAWLFYPEPRKAQRQAVLARLADQVVMELGERPASWTIFRFRSELRNGRIWVEEEGQVPADELFSPEYGYVEQTVSDPAGLESWLGRIDDVTRATLVPGGIRLAGRRHSQARTSGVTWDDVAALYQAHCTLKAQRAELDDALRRVVQPLADAWEALIDEYNRNVARFNVDNWALIDATSLDRKLGAVRRLLGDERNESRTAAHPHAETFLSRAAGGSGFDLPGGASFPDSELERLLGGLGKRQPPAFGMQRGNEAILDGYRQTIDALEKRVEAKVEELQTERLAELLRDGKVPPGEPGFSLDPQWNVAGLVADLRTLLEQPREILAKAEHLLQQAERIEYDPKAIPIGVSRAQDLMRLFQAAEEESSEQRPADSDEVAEEDAADEDAESYRSRPRLDAATYAVPEHRRARLQGILRSVAGKSGQEAEEGAILPFLELQEELKAADSLADLALLAGLRFLESQHRFQAARYDGPLQGTRVGMVLFYTDLLAKLWASVDYYGSAPAEHVLGFRSGPRIAHTVAPEFWEEIWRIPSTRLWFGPKPEGYASVPSDQSLSFAHVATRVYSASSNPLEPGREVPTSERSRRVMDWWDRHFAAVADYEPMYHVQNQIMKWSVITGWLVDQDQLACLNDRSLVRVNREHRFDRWYRDSDELRFRHDLRMLPEALWLSGTESLEILESYEFVGYGTIGGTISGGVSLGGGRSVTTGTQVSKQLPRELRRAGLDYSGSRAGAGVPGSLKSLKGAVFELPPARGPELITRITPPEAARFRSAAATYKFDTVTTRVVSTAADTRISVQTGVGDLGELISARTPTGSRLGWRKGSLEIDGSVAKKLSNRSNEGPEQAANLLAAEERLLPAEGGYVLQTQDRAAVVFGKGPPHNRGPPRVIEVLPPGSPERSGSYLSTAGLERDSLLSMLLGKRSSLVRVVAEPLESAAIAKRLEEFGWQRLKSLPDEVASEIPGRVHRVFRTDGPPAQSTPVTIRTGLAEMPEVQGFVAEGSLFLKRPAGVASEAFNDLVTSHGLTSKSLTGILARAETPGGGQIWQLQLRAAETPAGRLTSLVNEGKLSEAVQEIKAAARDGRLDETLQQFRAAARREDLRRMVQGEPTPATRRFIQPARGQRSADELVLESLRRLETRDLDSCPKLLKQAAEAGDISPEMLISGEAVARRQGQPAVGEFLRANSGTIPELSPDVAQRIELTKSGNRLELTFTERPNVAQRLLSPDEQRAALADGGAFYVKEGPLLSRLDWDAAPGHLLGRLVDKPRINWAAIDADGLGPLRPGRIRLGNQTFALPAGEVRGESPSRPTEARASYYLIWCDSDQDEDDDCLRDLEGELATAA